MTDTEKQFFFVLTKSRREEADILDRPNLRGIKKSIIDKYSDQAHFVYELLQNADDAGATEASFDLSGDRLVFIHNGPRPFNVTDPKKEDEDSINHRLGDVNAITAIGLSSKQESNAKGNSIGKFGMGFKSVFQYTDAPEIYAPGIAFRIERQIVPVLLDHDYPGRKAIETVFVFPFTNQMVKNPKDDSLKKLNSLIFPTLFLHKLETIVFNCASDIGQYEKKIVRTETFGGVGAASLDTTGELIEYTKSTSTEKTCSRIWLFSRTDAANMKYSVGFLLDENGHVTPTNYKAFCFFPTRHETGLNFIIQAPFLLTDSREGIKASEPHNEDMIAKLAQLSADSILLLRNIGEKTCHPVYMDDILDILPLKIEQPEDSLSFRPFYEEMLRCFKTERVVPAQSGYVYGDHAIWPTTKQQPQVFDDKQLQQLYGQPYYWAFTSRWNDSSIDRNVANFIHNCTVESPTDISLLDKITAEFIEKMSVTWLAQFYKWIGENSDRVGKGKRLPIFLNQQNKAVAAFPKDSKEPILFLPMEGADGGNIIAEKILAMPEACELIRRYDLKTPSKADLIRVIIDEKIGNCPESDLDRFLKIIVEDYSRSRASEKESMDARLRRSIRLRVKSLVKGFVIVNPGQTPVYFPTEDLKTFFLPVDPDRDGDVLFLDVEHYQTIISEACWKDFKLLLDHVGVASTPQMLIIKKHWYEMYNQPGFDRKAFSEGAASRKDDETYMIRFVDGASPLMKRITQEKEYDEQKKLSLSLWAYLVMLCGDSRLSAEKGYPDLHSYIQGCKPNILSGVHTFFNRGTYIEGFNSPQLYELRNTSWLITKDQTTTAPKDITRDLLAEQYKVQPGFEMVCELLEIKQPASQEVMEAQEALLNRLPPEIRTVFDLLQKEFSGKDSATISAEIKEIQAWKLAKERQKSQWPAVGPIEGVTSGGQSAQGSSSILERIATQVKELARSGTQKVPPPLPDPFEDDSDDDELIPRTVDFGRQRDRLEQKQAVEIAALDHFEELQHKALSLTKYSFGWFKTLLDLEIQGVGKDDEAQRDVSIRFTKMGREPGTERTFVLERPSRSIPQWLEELTGIPLELTIGKNVLRPVIEVMSVKSYTLKIKIKATSMLDGVNLQDMIEAKITVQRPTFLLTALRDGLCALPFGDDKNLKADLTENIEFVFGPPGTGKTTFLAEQRIINYMRDEKDLKVLVLAPTNKAADVLTARVVEKMGPDESYKRWLIRFGSTADESLEKLGVARGKDCDLQRLPRHVLVTTIDRFPYDAYIPGNAAPQKLVDQAWDYIVIDEASMIPLVKIIYPLYQKTASRFVIAGDPFQIEPIIQTDQWKDENIYTMVGLKDFVQPRTEPHQYPIEKLQTQYRSVPAIGRVFGSYQYGGVLLHNRRDTDLRVLRLPGLPEIKPLTIIKFPVSPYESIYRLKRLGSGNFGSSYQVYSAIFAFEFVCDLAKRIRFEPHERKFRIGVISPYRAQANIVQRLIESTHVIGFVEIMAGTIHGFQGDECDMIVALFNPPPGIGGRKGSFINKKNIINVSISRARDYLVVLMPDDSTPNLENMIEVRKVEALMLRELKSFAEYTTDIFEQAIFGNRRFIEENSFSTGHQDVNVYKIPDKRYEIRSEDTAVDIQLHG